MPDQELLALSFDVVVIGFGAAGASVALECDARGLTCLVLEKQLADAHTPSISMSGGSIMCLSDPEAGGQYLRACAAGWIPDEVTDQWAVLASSLPDWLASRTDLQFAVVNGAEHPSLSGSEHVQVVTVAEHGQPVDRSVGRGATIFRSLKERVLRSTAVVWYGVTPQELVTDAAGGGVSGVVVELSNSERKTVRARGGVVVACGGLEFHDGLKKRHLPVSPVHFYGNRGNTGDGFTLVEGLGLELWHMDQFVGRGVGHFEHPELGELNFMLYTAPPGYMIVDGHGLRFADESGQAELRHDFFYHLLAQAHDGTRPRVPAYWLFDSRRFDAGPLTNLGVGMSVAAIYRWSEDNEAELGLGWIKSGGTPGEAAALCGVLKPDAVDAEVAAFNQNCRSGAPDPFGRPVQTMVPLDSPPFYCVPLWPGGSHSTGGPRRDDHGRLVAGTGPVPGLYGAGEFGQVTGRLYPAAGASLSEAFCSARLAVMDISARLG